MPVRVSAPLLVIRSELELPLSLVSATPGADGAIGVEGEAQAGGAGHVAGHIGLANLNGVDALDRRERIAPGRAVVD